MQSLLMWFYQVKRNISKLTLYILNIQLTTEMLSTGRTAARVNVTLLVLPVGNVMLQRDSVHASLMYMEEDVTRAP